MAKIDYHKIMNLKYGHKVIRAIVDSGTQIPILWNKIIDENKDNNQGKIEIRSAWGDMETILLRTFHLKFDDGKHGTMPSMCAISTGLVGHMLLSQTAYKLLENILNQFHRYRKFLIVQKCT